MKNYCPSFLIINHKNEIEIMDELRRTNEAHIYIKTLTIIGNDNQGKNIKKFFKEYNIDNSTDFFQNSLKLCSKKKIDKSLISDSINRILNNNKNDNFIKLTNKETKDLSIILSEIYYKIHSQKKIKDNETFLKEIEKIKAENVDIISKYLISNNNVKQYKKKVSFLQQNNITNQGTKEQVLSINQVDDSFLKDYEIVENEYQYKEFRGDENNIIPIECKILLKKFQIIKKIKLQIDNKNNDNLIDKNTINNTILVLLNINWLFYNIIDLEIDLSNEELYNDYLLLYSVQLNLLSNYTKKNLRNTNYSGFYNNKRIFDPFLEGKNNENDDNNNERSDSINNTSIFEAIFFSKNIITYEEFLNKYAYIFELIFIYSYFISQIKQLYNMNIIIPDEMETDVIKYLKRKQINLNSFQFISFLLDSPNLGRFTCDFNSLDSNSFETILAYIYKNKSLRSLRLSLFPPEEFFSTQMLIKLLDSLKYNFKTIFHEVKNFSYFDEANNDIDSLILNKLLNGFEKNLNSLFHLLSIKSEIIELSLLFDIPSILQNNDLYMMILIKFLYNIFSLLGQHFNNYQTLIIQSENSSMDNRRNPFLISLFNKLKLYEWKLSRLKNFTVQIKFYHIYNIYNIIPPNLSYLSIGSFDKETFQSFIIYITSHDYNSISKLNYLQITLNNTIINYSSVLDLFTLLFTQYPKTLKNITIYSQIEINEQDLINFININNYNTLENITLYFSKRSLINRKAHRSFNSNGPIIEKKIFNNCYYIIRNKKKINTLLYLMNNLSKKINNNLMCYNIFHSIEKFIFRNKKKELIINYI